MARSRKTSQPDATVSTPDTVDGAAIVADSLIDLHDVRRRTGNLGRATIWRHMREGTFPRPVRMGNRVLFVAREIDQWIAERIASREA